MPECQEPVEGVSPLGPDVVSVIVVEDAPPAMGSLPAGRIQGGCLGRLTAAATKPAWCEGRAAGDQAQEELTTSTWHASVLGTAVLNRSYQPHQLGWSADVTHQRAILSEGFTSWPTRLSIRECQVW